MIALTPQQVAWALFKRFWPALPILALIIALMVTRSTLATRSAQVIAEQNAHLATKANFRGAMADAVNNATAAKRDAEAHYADLQRKADDDYRTLATDYRARTDVYAWRMRVTAAAARRDDRRDDLPVTPAAPEIPDRPDSDTFVLVSRSDLDIFVENQARLINAQNWVKGLGE